MSLIEVARFYCLIIIEFVILHCNNVSRVFSFGFVRACWMIGDWCLVPVRDWLVSLPLVWFFTDSFLAVCPFCLCGFYFRSGFCGGSIFAHLDALFFCCVLLCFYLLSVLHFGKAICSGPGHLDLLEGSLILTTCSVTLTALGFGCQPLWATGMVWIC